MEAFNERYLAQLYRLIENGKLELPLDVIDILHTDLDKLEAE